MAAEKKQSFKEIIQGEKPVLVDFYADWCGPCKMMAPIIQDVSGEMGDRVRVLKIDVDKNANAATAYAIQGVPTLILFKAGKIVWRQSGVVPGHVLKQVLKGHVAA